MAKDNSIMISSSKDDKASTTRWINMANRLNYLNQIPQIIMNSKFIGYVAGLLVIDRQMKKCLAVVRTAGPEKNIKQV
jgi:hypothetical protein